MRKLVPVLMCCMVVATGASAQGRDVVVTGGDGAILSLSPETLYRALGDRIVSGNDVIGNNAVDWSRIDPSLPGGRIELDLPVDVDEARVLGAVRFGCEMAGGSARACDRVGLRRDRIVRRGGYFDDSAIATLRAQVYRRGADSGSRARMGATASPPPPPAPEPVVGMSMAIAPAYLPPSAPEAAPVPMPPPAAVATPAPVAKPPVVVAVDAIVTEPLAEMAIESDAPRRPRSGRVHASRLFTGREGFPPEAFAAYGIVAFSTLATSEDRDTYMAICEAFFSALINSGDLAADASEQMVTAWPVDDRRRPDLVASLNTTRAQEGSCENAVEFYDVQVARGAIGDAMQAGIPLSGRGPFLLAWAPAGMKGNTDAVVLAADLSDVKTVNDAKDVLRIWREDIEQDPDLWQNGFSVEKIRVKLRLIVDRYGEGLLRFLGG